MVCGGPGVTSIIHTIHNPHNFSAKCDHYFPRWTPGSQLSHFQAAQSVLMFCYNCSSGQRTELSFIMPLLVSVSSGARLPHPPQLPLPGADPLHRDRRHRGDRHPQQRHRACPHRAQHHRLETPGQWFTFRLSSRYLEKAPSICGLLFRNPI